MTNKRFVILTTQRSGSTWVMSTLGTIPGVRTQGELFLPRPRSKDSRWDAEFSIPRYVERRDDLPRVRPFSVFAYLDDLYGAEGTVGFKLMYSQLRRFPEILAYLVARRVPVVHLVRRNYLDVHISIVVKRRLGRAHILAGQARPENLQVELDTGTLLASLRRLKKKQRIARTVLRASTLRWIEIGYEELVSDTGGFDQILSFLSIPGMVKAGETNLVRIRSGGQASVVANFDRVRALLEGTEFADTVDANP